MDILKISDDSLKVMLTAEDMNAYSLNCETITEDRKHSVEILREILRDAGEKCGFSSDGAKFYVQLYASPKGECEIFVRRLGETVMSLPDYKWETETLCPSPSTTGHGVFVYSFDAIFPMIETCSRLKFAKYFGESAAYKEIGGRLYYLILEERSPLPEEHGGRLCSKIASYYINEHCKLICEGAVETLGNLA